MVEPQQRYNCTTTDRPQLAKLMKRLAAGDVVITPAVGRLSRDTTDLLVIAREMRRAGAGILSLAEPYLDTTSDFAEAAPAPRPSRRDPRSATGRGDRADVHERSGRAR